MAGRILVLDDEENYAEMLQDLLRDNNYRVDMATRPERALDQLEEIPYDLVISDYKMPVMDGADFLKKSRELYPNLPFILVSGLMNTPELVKVANMSVTLVMEKPLDTDAFLKHVARFSEPMTEEEKSAVAREADSADTGESEATENYPEEPRFFRALSPKGKRFMQKAWTAAKEGSELYLLEPEVGEAELAAKDISQWRGNGDMPVSSFDLPETIEGGVAKLRQIAGELDQSNTICIRVRDAGLISQAKALTEVAIREEQVLKSMLLIYVVAGDDVATFKKEVGDAGLVIPRLADRPSDLAAYAQRFARIVSERSGRTNCSKFEAGAVFLLLSQEWEGGYKQVQEVIVRAVNSSEEDAPIAADLLRAALSLGGGSDVAPESRMGELMKFAQQRYLEREILEEGISAEEIAQKFEFDSSIRSREDLLAMPLVNDGLAKL
jgi:CheY-like chemotaxis protein